ncbi:uncharacterized protein LOC141883794 isoform X2 [Acropora palmata]|uniref:uncharacterized protein LOC141883794 isoform X2 n=1 Tax=Acropora palmata TaxID=6131 RepID=UPI003DA179DE
MKENITRNTGANRYGDIKRLIFYSTTKKTTVDCLENKSLELERSCKNSRYHDSRRKSMLYVDNWSLISRLSRFVLFSSPARYLEECVNHRYYEFWLESLRLAP